MPQQDSISYLKKKEKKKKPVLNLTFKLPSSKGKGILE